MRAESMRSRPCRLWRNTPKESVLIRQIRENLCPVRESPGPGSSRRAPADLCVADSPKALQPPLPQRNQPPSYGAPTSLPPRDVPAMCHPPPATSHPPSTIPPQTAIPPAAGHTFSQSLAALPRFPAKTPGNPTKHPRIPKHPAPPSVPTEDWKLKTENQPPPTCHPRSPAPIMSP